MSNSNETKLIFGVISAGSIVLLLLIFLFMWGCPTYYVWEMEMSGKASYAKAEQDRKIAVLEAEAKKDAAVRLAEAEVLRADGVAKANKIIGESLNKNELYLHYLWIQNLHEGKNDVIYIPTEAGIPIMEANRFRGKK